MSIGLTLYAMHNTPDPMKRLAAAILALAIDDLGSRKHQQDARAFLYSGTCEVYAGVIGTDYMEFRNRLLRNIERRGIKTLQPLKGRPRRPLQAREWQHQKQTA